MGIIRALKAHFRYAFRRAIVEAIDEDEDRNAQDIAKSINLLHAMDMLKEAWTQLSEETIRNCWRKGGFTNQSETLNDSVPVSNALISPGMSETEFSAWVELDDGIETMDELTIEEFEGNLVDQIKEKENQLPVCDLEDEDVYEIEVQEPIPTSREMKAALKTLERGLQATDYPHFDHTGKCKGTLLIIFEVSIL